MFDLAQLGLVAWPTKVPDLEQTDPETGGSLFRTIDVRYQILDRAELREVDAERARTLAVIAAERFAEIGSEQPPADASAADIEAFHRARAERIKAATEELAAKAAETEEQKIARLIKRVRAFRAERGGEWTEFQPGQLEQMLRLNPYVIAFDDGLMAASRGARAKN